MLSFYLWSVRSRSAQEICFFLLGREKKVDYVNHLVILVDVREDNHRAFYSEEFRVGYQHHLTDVILCCIQNVRLNFLNFK